MKLARRRDGRAGRWWRTRWRSNDDGRRTAGQADKLDGSETVTENPRGKTASKAKLQDGGKVFEITSVT
jgi:hypothetical protein